MVTTRRGTETPGQDSAATPRSSARRNVLKRELEALDTPTAAKRQKRGPPKKKADDVTAETVVAPDSSADDTSDTIAVAVSREQAPTQAQADKLPIRRRSSPQVLIAKPSPARAKASEDAEEAVVEDAPVLTQETVFHTPNQKSDSVYETPATRSRPRASPTPRAKRTSERTSSARKSSRSKTQMQSEAKGETTPSAAKALEEIPSSSYESEQAPIPSQNAPQPASQAEKAHMRFGSEEPEDAQESVLMNLQGHKRYEAPATTQAEIADSDDDASDSDEAPEVVTTTAAASKAAASQQDASRAQRAQQEKERLKREAREQRIAAEQAEKRKRDEKKAKKLAKQLAKEAASVAEPSTQAATPAIDLAGLLPPSLLETIPDHRAPTPPLQSARKSAKQVRQEKLNHHIKFLERTDKGVKDIQKGKLSVAVLGQQNKVLPPKVNRGSRDVREKWLKGRHVESRQGAKGKRGVGGGKMERKEFGNKGFSRKGHE